MSDIYHEHQINFELQPGVTAHLATYRRKADEVLWTGGANIQREAINSPTSKDAQSTLVMHLRALADLIEKQPMP